MVWFFYRSKCLGKVHERKFCIPPRLVIFYPQNCYLYEKVKPMYGEKIKLIREMRGYSQEYVAAELGIAQNTYSKIENNQTRLKADVLERVARLFDVSPLDIISSQPAIVNFVSNKGTQQSFGYVENYISEQKELYEKILAAKDAEIARLQSLVEALMKR